ncbi:MAG TPA: Do family serine endopeptidase [Steroidobacteraceae bacterium]|jgi:serine protease Do|nr:Do family serine endopeptidase [Steroidobacteraceae bacterium]
MLHRDFSPRLFGAIFFITLFAACSPQSGAAAPAGESDTSSAASSGTVGGGHLFQTGVVTASPAAVAAASRGLPDFSGLVQQVGSAVVNVQVVEKQQEQEGGGDDQGGGGGGDNDDPFGDFFRRFGIPTPNQPPRNSAPVRGVGSGFIIAQNGYILTNAHVVANATKVTVRLTDRREFDAKVIGVDEKSDIAVIKINAQGNLPVVSIGNSDSLKPGQWVLAIGSPFGFVNTVTAGIVSATARTLPNGGAAGFVPFIQTDVPVNPGNSGGPLFNLEGQVVGINSEIFSQSGAYEGISFAIPINVATNVADQLVRSGHVVRGRIGVTIQTVTAATADNLGLPFPRGAAVASVEPGGPADKAGIQPLDVILSVNGKQVPDDDELPSMIAEIPPGNTAHLQVWRDKKTIEVDVRVGLLPQSGETASAGSGGGGSAVERNVGLSVRTLSAAEKSQLKTRGNVVITSVSGPAAEAMLQPGDVILSINRTPITDIAQFQRAIRGGHEWTLLISRVMDGTPQQLIVTISSR